MSTLKSWLDGRPAELALHDAMDGEDHIFGDDVNAPLGEDDEPLAWEGELIDDYPARELSVSDVLKQRKKTQKEARLEAVARAELPHVPEVTGDAARVYVARIRAARRLGVSADEMHASFYDGRRPAGIEVLAELGFEREARWARAGMGAQAGTSASAGKTVTASCDAKPSRVTRSARDDRDSDDEPVGEPADPRMSTWAEARLYGRSAALQRHADLMRTADQMMTGFAENDRVQNGDGPESVGTVEAVEPDGKIRVRRESGGTVTYDQEAAQKLQRQASRTEAIHTPTHAPKGTKSPGKKGDRDVEGGEVELKDGLEMVPELELTAIVRWPNVAMLSAALPKVAGSSWIDDIDRAIVRAGGSWMPNREAYQLEARFPTKEAARRFAQRLVGEFFVRPGAIEAATEHAATRAGGRRMRFGFFRVDLARRIFLPGGLVFALEGSPSPTSFSVNDGALVVDPLSGQLAEGRIVALGPDIAVLASTDGAQYEYARGMLRRLTLARLSLAHAPDDLIPKGHPVQVGRREGTLIDVDGDQARVRFDDGPRNVPRAQVIAIVRVANLSEHIAGPYRSERDVLYDDAPYTSRDDMAPYEPPDDEGDCNDNVADKPAPPRPPRLSDADSADEIPF